MKKSYRRALFFVALLVFMAATPLVILYALGYRTSLSAADPVPVGVLLIETEPSRAKVFINDALVGQTPRSVSNLRAGEVTVRIEKGGYAPWQKKLRISPGRATEIRDIRLFPQEAESQTIATNVEQFSLSPSRRLVATVQATNTLALYDQTGEVIMSAEAFSSPILSVLWSPNSDALLIKTLGRTPFWYVSLTPSRSPVPVALPALTEATNVVWDPRIPGRLLFQDHSHVLRAYNIVSKAQVPLLQNVAVFATSASHIFTVQQGEAVVTEYTLQGQSTGRSFAIPTSEILGLFVTPQENIALHFSNGEVGIRDESGLYMLVASGIKKLSWSPSGKVLLLASDTSLHVYNVNDKRTTLPLHELQLVVRLSRAIVDPQWFAGSRHVLYQVDDEIWIVETDTRDHPVGYQVDTTNTGSTHATVGEEGESIFYLKNIQGTTTLVVAPLVLP